MSVVYISGAISGVKDYMTQFNRTQARLERSGIEVMNPARILSNMPKSTTYDEYMKLCIEFINQSDEVLMLDGWEKSRGARFEHEYAQIIGLPIRYENKKETQWQYTTQTQETASTSRLRQRAGRSIASTASTATMQARIHNIAGTFLRLGSHMATWRK